MFKQGLKGTFNSCFQSIKWENKICDLVKHTYVQLLRWNDFTFYESNYKTIVEVGVIASVIFISNSEHIQISQGMLTQELGTRSSHLSALPGIFAGFMSSHAAFSIPTWCSGGWRNEWLSALPVVAYLQAKHNVESNHNKGTVFWSQPPPIWSTFFSLTLPQYSAKHWVRLHSFILNNQSHALQIAGCIFKNICLKVCLSARPLLVKSQTDT